MSPENRHAEAAASAQRLTGEVVRRYRVDAGSVRTVFAPYRVCPLGAHIDHQSGPVTALAIGHGVLLAFAPNTRPAVRLSSLDFPGEVRCDFCRIPPARPGEWGNYLRGAVQALQAGAHTLEHGWVGVTSGAWSEGGLGSSAAIGLAYLLALEAVNGLDLSPAENLRLDQAIENRYLGLRSGLLDQAGVLLSRKHCLTLIDCATAEHGLIPLPCTPPPWRILIASSGVTRALGRTDYNLRVAECAEAAQRLLACAGRPGVIPKLGNLTDHEYAEHRHRLSGPPARRAAHFFTERDRVRRGVEAWRQGDWPEFGRLMTASGESSIENYECGCPPLIDLFDILARCPGVHGARFSGAGFRGCCIAWVAADSAAQAVEHVRRLYAQRQPTLAPQAPVILTDPEDGARFVGSPGGIRGGILVDTQFQARLTKLPPPRPGCVGHEDRPARRRRGAPPGDAGAGDRGMGMNPG